MKRSVQALLFVSLLTSPLTGCHSDAPTTPVPPTPTIRFIAEDAPAWSPDGTTIAYQRKAAATDGPPGLYLIDQDGSNNRLLIETPTGALLGFQELRFSPSGTELALTFELEVVIVDLETASLRTLTQTGGNARNPDWSPDGTSIVYTRPASRGADVDSSGVYIVDVATGNERALFYEGTPVYGGGARWSPLGEPIVFWSGDRTESLDIFAIRSDGTGLRRLTNAVRPVTVQWPRWIDDGQRILYQWDPGVVEGKRTHVMNADGSGQSTWPVFFIGDAISPDSRWFVDIRARADSIGVLFVRRIDDEAGTTQRELTNYTPP